MITNAIILAAGLGSRIEKLTKSKPKGFIKIGETTLIERSINLLLQNGISKIYIGTGHKSIFYDRLKKSYTSISTKKNKEYKDSGSFHTLYNFQNLINDDFLLLESDLLFESTAVKSLIDDARKDIILTSDFTNSGDEVFVIGKKDLLRNLTKSPSKNEVPLSEFVGISKISINLFKTMCREYMPLKNKNLEYEEMLNKCSEKQDIFIKKLKDIIWCEIDNEQHLSRAIDIIAPKILENEKV